MNSNINFFSNQYFEQDDPELYLSKVKYILDNDLDHQSCAAELYFVEEEYDKIGRLSCSVDLIPNGSHIKVNYELKIYSADYYLNKIHLLGL